MAVRTPSAAAMPFARWSGASPRRRSWWWWRGPTTSSPAGSTSCRRPSRAGRRGSRGKDRRPPPCERRRPRRVIIPAMARRLRIAVNTGGGDAPGLNAVLRAVTLTALNRGFEVFGIQKGYLGLLDTKYLVPLTSQSVRGITHLGGSILGTNNRGNPLGMRVVEEIG